MISRKLSISVMLCLALGGFVRANEAPNEPVLIVTSEAGIAGGWIASERDNICGISTLKRVTNPAQVDFDTLLAATPQVKEMERKRIDPGSAEGRALRRSARTLITKASELVRKARGHCSVWKVIAHKDGRGIPNVTGHVLDRF
jgi:hypothetical protein